MLGGVRYVQCSVECSWSALWRVRAKEGGLGILEGALGTIRRVRSGLAAFGLLASGPRRALASAERRPWLTCRRFPFHMVTGEFLTGEASAAWEGRQEAHE